MTTLAAGSQRDTSPAPADAAAALPSADAWRAAATHHHELFAPLGPGVRIALFARSAPEQMLVWEAGAADVAARSEPFAGYNACAAAILLAADDAALADLRAAPAASTFATLRAGIRAGHVVCYMLERRCVLEERGLDELLDALGFAFMGACR